MMDNQLNEPQPPEHWECCEGGCGDACVWQIYYREKAAFERSQKPKEIPVGDVDD